MDHYAGIDVSLELSSVCVVDAKGKIIKEAKISSDPGALVTLSDHRWLTMVCRLLPGTGLLHTVPSAESCAFERQPMKRRRDSEPKEMAG